MEDIKVTNINVGELEEDIKILKEWVERDREIRDYGTETYFDKFCEKKNTAIENILNRLEQDEIVLNNAIIHLEYYLLGNSRFEDSQEEFNKLLKMLKRD